MSSSMLQDSPMVTSGGYRIQKPWRGLFKDGKDMGKKLSCCLKPLVRFPTQKCGGISRVRSIWPTSYLQETVYRTRILQRSQEQEKTYRCFLTLPHFWPGYRPSAHNTPRTFALFPTRK